MPCASITPTWLKRVLTIMPCSTAEAMSSTEPTFSYWNFTNSSA